MKKLISLLLVICVLCPLLVGCGNNDEEFKMKKRYLHQFKIEDKAPKDVVVDYDGGKYNGARIVMLDAEWHDPEEWTEKVGKMIVRYYDSNRLYVYKNNKFYTLEEAQKYSILSETQMQSIIGKYNVNITNYLDVCDKYDFQSSEECDIQIGSHMEDCHRQLIIGFDIRIFNAVENKSDHTKIIEDYISSYFGENICKFYRHIGYSKDKKMTVYRFKYSYRQSIEDIPNIMEKLSKTPGIVLLWCDCIYHDPGSSASYSQPDNNGLWGLNHIKIDKVWDFTTESKHM